MKIFSELIIDSYFRNSKFCTCSIFHMISASSIFAIAMLHHVPCKIWLLGTPNLLYKRLPVEELHACHFNKIPGFQQHGFQQHAMFQQPFDPNGFEFGKISMLAHDRG